MRSALLCAFTLGGMTACLVSIDESRLDADTTTDHVDAGNKKSSTSSGESESSTSSSGSSTSVVDASLPPVEAGADLPGSCKEAKDRGTSTTSGPATIQFNGEQVTVFCDQTTDGGGWTMLFRLSAGPGITGDPMEFYSTFGLNDAIPEEVTPKKTNSQYTSRILSHWNEAFTVTDALVGAYDSGGAMVKSLRFGGVGTTFLSFFAPEHLVSSSWTDLGPNPAASTFSDFSAAGSSDIGRRFNVNKKYAGCPNDSGWFVAHASLSAPPACDYENPTDHIRIYVAPESTAQAWPTSVSEASSMAIFAR
jgi:hypothetical protein